MLFLTSFQVMLLLLLVWGPHLRTTNLYYKLHERAEIISGLFTKVLDIL